MTPKQLKKLIKDRFGSLTKFTTLAKMDRYELQKFFAAADKKMTPERATRIVELAKLARKTKVAPTSSELTPELRKRIKQAIQELDGVTGFCGENGFSPVSIHHIIDGRRKTISATVRQVLKVLNIQHP